MAFNNTKLSPDQDYPIGQKHPEWVKTRRGHTLQDITLRGVAEGFFRSEDLRITAETLELQAKIAESVGRRAMAQNLRRAAELVGIPDTII
jgi:propanediol dehydratase small subunit